MNIKIKTPETFGDGVDLFQLEINKKIELLKKINNDNSTFIINVLESFIKYKSNFNNYLKNTSIILKSASSINLPNVIDLDMLWAHPYFYTRMKIRLEKLVKIVLSTPDEVIIKKTNKFFKHAIYNDEKITFTKPENKIDIADFIKNLSNDPKYNIQDTFTFVCEKIDEESLFKELELKKAINILRIPNIEERNRIIYDEICSYLKQDFIGNHYCDFINNKCIAQRHLNMYPMYRKNGCCFKNIRIM